MLYYCLLRLKMSPEPAGSVIIIFSAFRLSMVLSVLSKIAPYGSSSLLCRRGRQKREN